MTRRPRPSYLKTGLEPRYRYQTEQDHADTPQLNRAMAKVYASATSPELMTRTWTEVMTAYAGKSANGSRERAERAMRSQPLAPLKKLQVYETDASVFFEMARSPSAQASGGKRLAVRPACGGFCGQKPAPFGCPSPCARIRTGAGRTGASLEGWRKTCYQRKKA